MIEVFLEGLDTVVACRPSELTVSSTSISSRSSSVSHGSLVSAMMSYCPMPRAQTKKALIEMPIGDEVEEGFFLREMRS